MSENYDNEVATRSVAGSSEMMKYYALGVGLVFAGLLSMDNWVFTFLLLALVGLMLFMAASAIRRQNEATESNEEAIAIIEERHQQEVSSLKDEHKSELGRFAAELASARDQKRQQELTLEKQLKLKDFPLADHFKPFMDKLKATKTDEIEGLTHTQFMELYIALEETFKRNNRLPLSRLAEIPDEVRRVNKIETLIDLYAKKMQKVRADSSLDEEDRDHKISNWERIMERDIAELEGS